MRREKTKDMILCGMFVALIAAGAFIKIPIPVIPFTLQYLFTMMAGLLLGPKKGCLAVLIYILLGLMGLPIFAQGGGIGYLVQPSFGYLAGFAAGAYVTGFLAEAEKYPGIRRLLAASSGAQQSTAVTEEQAKEIAASKAGLSVSDLSFFWMEKEWDDGRLCYEGEFVYKTTEYEFEIDVNTGTITEWDTESIYD